MFSKMDMKSILEFISAISVDNDWFQGLKKKKKKHMHIIRAW